LETLPTIKANTESQVNKLQTEVNHSQLSNLQPFPSSQETSGTNLRDEEDRRTRQEEGPILSRIEACADVMITQRNPTRHYIQKSHKPGETEISKKPENSKKPEIKQICQTCLQIPKKRIE